MPGKKPGPVAGSAKTDHADLTKQLIAAIEAAQRQPAASPEALTSRAYDKLQYDFPLLDIAELEALSSAIRGALEAKGGPTDSFLITPKLVENITRGALGSAAQGAATQPASTSAGQSDQQPALTPPSPEAQRVRAAYQRLCVVILLQFVNAVLSAPEGEAWRLLASYIPPSDEDSTVEDQEPEAAASSTGAAGNGSLGLEHLNLSPEQAVAAAAAAMAAGMAGDGPVASQAPACTVYEEPVAAVEDDDDVAYEPLEAPAAAPAAATGAQRKLGAGVQQQQRQGLAEFGIGMGLGSGGALEDVWPSLQSRLLHLAAPEHLMALAPPPTTSKASAPRASGAPTPASTASTAPDSSSSQAALPAASEQPAVDVWADTGATGAVLALLRTAGVHERSKDLQPLVSSYVALLGDRLAGHPSEVDSVLEQLWDALGVKGLASMPKGAGGRRAGGAPAVLPAEASLAFNTVCNLAVQAASSSQVRGALWRQVHTHLLGVLERCLCDLAAGGPAAANPQTLAAVSLTCQVVALYLEHAPGNADPAATLLSAGIVRGLSLLLPIYASQPGGETLRAAASLTAAASADGRKWMLAVPGVSAALVSMARSEPALPHAVLWHLLEPQALAAAAAAPPKPGAQVQPVEQQAPCGPTGIAEVLQQGVQQGDTPALGRMHAVLSLMVRCGQVSGRKVSWGREAESALRQAASALRDTGGSGAGAGTSPNNSSGGADAGTAGPAMSIAAAENGSHGDGGSDRAGTDAEEQKEHSAGGAGALHERRAHQLRPACLKLIKQLLTSGGKTD